MLKDRTLDGYVREKCFNQLQGKMFVFMPFHGFLGEFICKKKKYKEKRGGKQKT